MIYKPVRESERERANTWRDLPKKTQKIFIKWTRQVENKLDWGMGSYCQRTTTKKMRTFTTIPYRVSLLGTGKHFYNFVPLLSFCGTSHPLGIFENTYKNTLGTVSFRFSYFIMLSLDMTFYLYI